MIAVQPTPGPSSQRKGDAQVSHYDACSLTAQDASCMSGPLGRHVGAAHQASRWTQERNALQSNYSSYHVWGFWGLVCEVGCGGSCVGGGGGEDLHDKGSHGEVADTAYLSRIV